MNSGMYLDRIIEIAQTVNKPLTITAGPTISIGEFSFDGSLHMGEVVLEEAFYDLTKQIIENTAGVKNVSNV